MVTVSLLFVGRRFRTPRDVPDAPQAARPPPVAVAVVDLAFDPELGPAGLLILRVEIDARVRAGEGHHVDLEVEVLEVVMAYVPDVEQVSGTVDRRGALHDDHAVADLEDVGVLAHLPAVEGLSVEEAHETLFRLRRIGGQGTVRQQQDRRRQLTRNFTECSFFINVVAWCQRAATSPTPSRDRHLSYRIVPPCPALLPAGTTISSQHAFISDCSIHTFSPVKLTFSRLFSRTNSSMVSKLPRRAASRPRIQVSVQSTLRWAASLPKLPATTHR